MEKDVSKKILEGHIARMNRRMANLMSEQMGIMRQIYKVDNRLDKISWSLSQNPDSENLKEAQKKYDVLLDKLTKEKYMYNSKLEKEKEKLDKYVDALLNLQKVKYGEFELSTVGQSR